MRGAAHLCHTLGGSLGQQLCLLDLGLRALLQLALVVDDRDVHLGKVDDLLVLDFPEVLGDLGDETEVVGHDDDTALEFLDCGSQGVDRRHVQVVSRLIEEEDVWVLECDLGETDTVPQSVGKLVDG